MQKIVDNCMGEETPACSATCPMHTDVKIMFDLLKKEKAKKPLK